MLYQFRVGLPKARTHTLRPNSIFFNGNHPFLRVVYALLKRLNLIASTSPRTSRRTRTCTPMRDRVDSLRRPFCRSLLALWISRGVRTLIELFRSGLDD